MRFIDLTGQRFGRLVVLSRGPNNKTNHVMWRCRCDCGKEIMVFSGVLRKSVRSCGCAAAEKARMRLTKHGALLYQKRDILYGKWQRMKSRCYRPADPKYKNYGARGITMCKEWKNDFGCFREWAIKNGYKPGLTIERIDVNGNYCPSNCKWIPMEEQAYNKTNTVYLTIDGQKLPLIKWAKKLNIDYRVLYYECIAKKRRKN
jgi:hypothetical protein